MIQHQFIDISEKVQDIRATFNRQSVNIADKLKTINESWKDVWPRLDTLEACCKSLVELIQCKVKNTFVSFFKIMDKTKDWHAENLITSTRLVFVFNIGVSKKTDSTRISLYQMKLSLGPPSDVCIMLLLFIAT